MLNKKNIIYVFNPILLTNVFATDLRWSNLTILSKNGTFVSGFCHFGLVFHGFVTALILPSCLVFTWAPSSRALSRLRAFFHVGAWCSDPGTHVLSFCFVSGFGHSRSMFCLIVWVCGLEFVRPRALLSTCVLGCCTQFVFLSAACIHVRSCAVWHAACVFIGCVLSCCHVLCEHVAYDYSH